MPGKLILLAYFVIVFHQLVLGEEIDFHNPICNKTVRKWTDLDVFNACSSINYYNRIYTPNEMMDYKSCIDRHMAEMNTVPTCCDGYKKKSYDHNRCEFDCERCKEGECGDDECSCAIGFGGKWCEKSCPLGHFGAECEHNCDCLTSPDCNPNYQNCKCNEAKIPAGCRNICKCHSHHCKDGLIGKNCTVPCPAGRYGRFCSKTCSCVAKNTRECLKEFGNCVCKDRFYGKQCEYECTGTLQCGQSSRCWCELTAEQKIEKVVADSSRIRNYLIAGLVSVSAFLLVASFLVFRYRIKSKRLKKELKNCSLRYSSEESKVVLNNPKHLHNPVYSNTMSNDRLLSPASPSDTQPTTKKGFLDGLTRKNLFTKSNWMSDDWLFKPFNNTLSDDSKKEDDKAYATIAELKTKSKGAKNDDPAV